MSEKLGIERIKENLTDGIKLGMRIRDIADDGIKWHEWPALGLASTKFPGVYSGFVASIPEWKDLDATESKEVAEHIASELDLPDDNVEAIIEETALLLADSYVYAQSGMGLLNRWKALFQHKAK